MKIDRDALLAILEALPFAAGHWVATGSAPLLAAGLIDSIQDVDIVTDAVGWQQATSLSHEEPNVGLFGDHTVRLGVAGAPVEVFDGWLGAPAAVLIAEAVEIDGYRFSPLERVLDSKRRLLRQKDLAHIDLLEAHLTGRPETTGT